MQYKLDCRDAVCKLVYNFMWKRTREDEVGWLSRWRIIWDDIGEANKYDQNILYEIIQY